MTVQIGELRARLVAEATQMKQEVQAVKKGFADLGEEGKKTSKSFTDLNATIAKVAANTDHLKSIEQQLKKIDPTKTEQGLAAIVAELQKMGAERKQIEVLEQALAEMSHQAQAADTRVGQLEEELKQLGSRRPDVDKVNEGLEKTDDAANKAGQGVQAISTGLASLGAGATLAKIVDVVKTLSGEANQLANSYRGLSTVTEKFNGDAEEAVDLAEKLANRWGLNKGTVADTIKTYTTLNFSLEESERIITATADAAAYGRQAHLTWDEAIKQVAEGIKSGNSNLTDAAGITTNLSVMQERYARSIGTTAAKLTEAQKIQAAYNGMIDEGAIFAGNADSAMTGYTGAQATFNQTIEKARLEIGEGFLPVLEELIETVTPIIKNIALWADGNEEMIAGLTAASVAVTGFIAVVAALTTAFIMLNSVMGPVGWAILAIGSLAAGVSAYAYASNATADSVLKFAKNQEELNRKLDESPLNRSVQDVKNLQSDIDTLNDILEQRNRLMESYTRLEDKAKSGAGSIENTHALFDLADQIKEVDKQLRSLDYKNVDEATKALNRMKKAVDDAVPALVQMQRAEIADLATKVQHNDEIKKLQDRYTELSKVQKLDQTQKTELASVVQNLKKEYPDLIAQLDEEGRWHIKNQEIIWDTANAEREAVRVKAELRKQELEDLKKQTEAKLKQAEIEIAAIEKVVQAQFRKSAPMMAQAEFDESSIPAWLTGEAREVAINQAKQLSEAARKQLQAETDSLNTLRTSLNEIKQMQQDLTLGNWDAFRNKIPNFDSGGGTKPKTPQEIRKEAFQQELAAIQFQAEMYDWSAEQQIAAYEKIRQKHKKHLADTVEDERSILLTIKQLTEEGENAKFAISENWISAEERRLKEKGASEEEIATMQLEAWTRVRNRYAEDTEFYKTADEGMYNARMKLIDIASKKEEEARKQREKDLKDLVSSSKSALKEMEREELKSIDTRKKAIQDKFTEEKRLRDQNERDELDSIARRRRTIEDAYDAEDQAADEAKYAEERKKIVAQMEKYQYAVSKEGQEKYRDLQEQLAELDARESQRFRDIEKANKLQALDDEQDEVKRHYDELERQRDEAKEKELRELEEQKEEIERYYDELEKAFDASTLRIEGIEAALQDRRLELLKATNARMRGELQAFVREYERISSITSSNPRESSVIAQMRANSAAWEGAGESGRRRLEEENQRLGASIGASYEYGTWYRNGVPLYHSGGIAGLMNFRRDDMLLPDEIQAIMKVGEVALQPQQLSALVGSAASASGTSGVTNNYYGPLTQVEEMNVRDDQDISLISRGIHDLQQNHSRMAVGRR